MIKSVAAAAQFKVVQLSIHETYSKKENEEQEEGKPDKNERSRPPGRPPGRPTRQINGPQSALTDFLASHNISANQIRQDADARRAAALRSQQEATEASQSGSAEASVEPEMPPPLTRTETRAQAEKRKKEEASAIAKIKASKSFQKKRRYMPDSDSDEDAIEEYLNHRAPLQGQMENCAICDKRFTVTGYTRSGPLGGLLCKECTKDLDQEEGAKKRKKKATTKERRRQIQSGMLDGVVPGVKSLVTLCVETLAKNVDLADDLGDLPEPLVERLAAILCKKRLMNPTTLNMFLQPNTEVVTVFDGANLTSDDYTRIFQLVPNLKKLRLRCAVQFKNKVMDFLIGSTIELESLSIHGANLIDNERWNEFLTKKGKYLQALKVYYTDGHFGDEQLELLPIACPNLKRLKVSHNQQVTDAGIEHIAKLSNLEHLTIQIYGATSTKPYVEVIKSIGHNLRTLCLDAVPYLEDDVLVAIHENCAKLVKLRITDNECFTDAGFASLFTNWSNAPLTHLDFRKCRHIDSTEPRDNKDKIGFCDAGFEAMMAHSGATLTYLNFHDCRHINSSTFEKVFAVDKKYPALKSADMSFVWGVNDFVVGSVFRSCPNIKTLKVFGNFGVRNVKVPRGKILIGMPTALGMEIEGDD